MRLALILAVTAAAPLLAGATDPRAPEPGQPPAQTPAQEAAQEMMVIYDEFCLNRFPDTQAVQAGAAAHHMVQETPDDAARVLLGRPGAAWRLTTPKGAYEVAIESGGRQGCAVSGAVADDAGIRAAFDIMVAAYASAHEFGALTRPPLQSGLVKGEPGALQLIGATPDGRPRQAFVNMATGAGPVLHVRMTRELAPS